MHNKYSVVNTNSKIIHLNKIKIFEKFFCINVPMMNKSFYIKKISRMTKDYYVKIKNAGISIPKLIELKVKSKKIICRMEYKGKNLIENNFNVYKKNYSENLDKVIHILYLAKKENICIDPHIKNFVINKKKQIFYVDIFPPYSKKFEKIRNKYYVTNLEKIICKKNFHYFKPANIFYHFVADLIRTNKNYYRELNFFYNKFSKISAIKCKKNFFKKKIFNIIRIEELRLSNNFFLV